MPSLDGVSHWLHQEAQRFGLESPPQPPPAAAPTPPPAPLPPPLPPPAIAQATAGSVIALKTPSGQSLSIFALHHTADVRLQREQRFFNATGAMYTLPNALSVRAFPHFQMSGGMDLGSPNDTRPSPATQAQTLSTELEKFKARNPLLTASELKIVGDAMIGRPRLTPEHDDVHDLVQLLINNGELDLLTNLTDRAGNSITWQQDPELAVRDLMWEYGVGSDCAGYTAQAVTYDAGKTGDALGLGQVTTNGGEITFGGNPHFTPVKLTDAQPGDAMQLADPGQVGHNLTVVDHYVATQAEIDQLVGSLSSQVETSDLTGGPIHVFVLDSSWGASGNYHTDIGGVYRREFLYNETTKRWALFDDYGATQDDFGAPQPADLEWSDHPYVDHVLLGVYRPR